MSLSFTFTWFLALFCCHTNDLMPLLATNYANLELVKCKEIYGPEKNKKINTLGNGDWI